MTRYTKLPPVSVVRPDIVEEWDTERNSPLNPHEISAGSSQKVWWICKNDNRHRWQAYICNRTQKKVDCPYCAGQLTMEPDSIYALRPGLMADWHPTKNGDLDPKTISLGSQKRIWWRCQSGHEWSTMAFTRAKDDKGCPYCTGRKASEKNSLATVFPDIAAEWHPTRNAPLTPADVTSRNHRRVWWKCKTCAYEWQTPVNMRTVNNSTCPLCSRDDGVLESKKTRLEKEETPVPDYDYETDGALLAHGAALQQLLTTQLKLEADLTTIESLLNPRLRTRINYQPYYQRNYVWDDDKATYFIESILIGTEIPPLILYDSVDGVEVIDGRQRFQTLLRFQTNDLKLTPKGLSVRHDLDGFGFDQLTPADKNFFFDAKLRLFRFTFVGATAADERTQDMLKKEIFRRYNSGITPLKQYEIEKAVYITDEPTQYIKDKFQKNAYLFKPFVEMFLDITQEESQHTASLMEKALQETRLLLVCARLPILATRKKDTLQQFYDWFRDSVGDVQQLYREFAKYVQGCDTIRAHFTQLGLRPTRFWHECMYWALAILDRENKGHAQLLAPDALNALADLYRQNATVYSYSETQFFYSQFLARYTTVSGFLEARFGLSLSAYIRNRYFDSAASKVRPAEDDLPSFVRIEKQDPMSLSVEDLCRDIQRSKYLLRPAYQRGEVINRAKSTGIVESMLLGIRLPPIYAYRREDGVCEIIDGQQRLLSILGFVGRPFLNERGEQVHSQKNGFALGKMRILNIPAVEGKPFTELDKGMQDRLWDFKLYIITIDEKFNPSFNPVDLFVRLNSRPYPIKENTFEMWNSYVDKGVIDGLKLLTAKHDKWFYLTRNNLRMRNHDLMALLTYLAHSRIAKATADNPVSSVVEVFRRSSGIVVRVKQKSAVTRMLDAATLSEEARADTLEAEKRTDSFIRKVRTLLIDDDATDVDSYLDQRLTALFNVENKRYYARRFHDFYALWYLLHDFTLEVVVKRRKDMRDDLVSLLRMMRMPATTEDTDPAPFINAVSAFKDNCATADRKTRLSRDDIAGLIQAQNRVCPLCRESLFTIDDIEVDHMVPLSSQGPDHKDNLQVVHKICNRKKGKRPEAQP